MKDEIERVRTWKILHVFHEIKRRASEGGPDKTTNAT